MNSTIIKLGRVGRSRKAIERKDRVGKRNVKGWYYGTQGKSVFSRVRIFHCVKVLQGQANKN